MEATAAGIAFIQFAGQTVKYIVKAHQLWGEIKDVPSIIEERIAELKDFEPLFREVEAQVCNAQSDFASLNNASTIASLEKSKRVHRALDDMIKDMGTELSTAKGIKQKMKAAKWLLRKEVIQRQEDRLNRALKLLDTSLNVYNRIIQQRQADIISKQIIDELKKHLDNRDMIQRQVFIREQTIAARMQPNRPMIGYENGYIEEGMEMPSNYKPRPTGLSPNPEVLQQAISTSEKSVSNRPWRFGLPSYFGRYEMSYTKKTGAWEAYVQLPPWLSGTVYEFRYAPIYSSWKFTTRVYNAVPRNSEIFRRVRVGDKAGVIELFETGKASPFDKDETGSSLLYYAIHGNQPAMCAWLLKLGLHELLSDNRGNILVNFMHSTARWQKVDDNTKQILEMLQRYLKNSDPLPIEWIFDLNAQDGQSATRPFKDKFMEGYYERPDRDRFEAFRLGAFVEHDSGIWLEFLDAQENISLKDVKSSTRERISLLHSAAIALGTRLPDRTIPRRRPTNFQYRIYYEDWSIIVAQIAKHCEHSDLHLVEEVTPWDRDPVPVWRGTAMMSLIGGSLCYLSPDCPFYYWDIVFQAAIRDWVSQLQKAGVDLVKYGETESRLLHDPDACLRGAFDVDAIKQSRTKIRQPLYGSVLGHFSNRRADTEIDAKDDRLWQPVRIIDITYGPLPSDWRLQWALEYEYFAFEFWQLLEEPDMLIPGSWVDE